MAASHLDLEGYQESDQFPMELPLIVFDSDCILCSRSMRILVWMDRNNIFWLTPVQGKLGATIYQALKIPIDDYETFLLVERSLVWGKSDAILRIVHRLGWPWRIFGLLKIIPRPVRDAIYMWIARNRYQIFGRRQACGLNISSLLNRII